MPEISNFVDEAVVQLFGRLPVHEELLAYQSIGWVHLQKKPFSPIWKFTPYGDALRGSVVVDEINADEETEADILRILLFFAVNYDPEPADPFYEVICQMADMGLVCRIRIDGDTEVMAVTAKGLFCDRIDAELPEQQTEIFAALLETGLMQRKFDVVVGGWKWSPTDFGIERGLASTSEIAISLLSKLSLGKLVGVEVQRQINQLESDGFLW